MSLIQYLKMWFIRLFYGTDYIAVNQPTPRLFRNLSKEDRKNVIVRIQELQLNKELTMKDITKIVNHEFNLKNTPTSFSNTLHRNRKKPTQVQE